MFRKLILGLSAAGSLALVGLAPTGASAWDGGHYHHRWHPGFGFHHIWGGPRPVYFGGSPCLVRRWVATPFGPRFRLVNRCY